MPSELETVKAQLENETRRRMSFAGICFSPTSWGADITTMPLSLPTKQGSAGMCVEYKGQTATLTNLASDNEQGPRRIV